MNFNSKIGLVIVNTTFGVHTFENRSRSRSPFDVGSQSSNVSSEGFGEERESESSGSIEFLEPSPSRPFQVIISLLI